jgi:hypothetical protein
MASTRLSDTMGTPTSGTKFTYSCWVKRSALGSAQTIASMWSDSSTHIVLRFDLQDNLSFYATQSSTYPLELETNAVFRDTSAWYHIVAKVDTTQSTSSDRCKLYVNGSEQTSLSASTYPSQDSTFTANASGTTHYVGGRGDGSYWDGLITHAHFTDGYAYDASTFGESDSTSGIWKPKTAPSVTYGTNGFFLKFENSGAMGTDSSGNSNTFAVGGGTLTQNVDTPSNNFATWNPISTAVARSGGTFANGNTAITTVAAKYNGCPATLGMSSGKYYFEVKWSSGSDDESLIGIQSAERTSDIQELGHFATDYGYYSNNGNIRSNDAYQGSFGNTYSVNDIIGVAVDLDNNKLYFSKNGVWQNSGVPTSGSTGTGAFSITDPDSTPTGFYFPAISGWSNSHAHTFQANFGQGYFGTTAVASAGTAPSEGGIFEYDCPSGYQALCTKGINSF